MTTRKQGIAVGIALVCVALVLLMFQDRDDPVMLTEVRCAATAAVLADMMARLSASTGRPAQADVIQMQRTAQTLADRVARMRAAGSVEGSYLARMIGEEKARRDAMIQSDGAEAWLAHARARVANCAGQAALHSAYREGTA